MSQNKIYFVKLKVFRIQKNYPGLWKVSSQDKLKYEMLEFYKQNEEHIDLDEMSQFIEGNFNNQKINCNRKNKI